MQKTSTTTKRSRPPGLASSRPVKNRKRAVRRALQGEGKVRTATSMSASVEGYSYIMEGGQATHVLVPLEEYERLIKASMVEHAIGQAQHGDDDFVDADDLALELAGQRIAKARKAAGITQKQLGDRLRIPQSQISRIERQPDHTTVRTLKRIARALNVSVRSLI